MAEVIDPYSGFLGVRARIAKRIQRGADSLFNLSVYSFGVSGVWTGFGNVVLPFKVIQIAENETIAFLEWELGKNSILALISLLGLVTVAIVQPLIGLASDKAAGARWSTSKRLPFVIFGLFGLAAITLLTGIAEAFITVLLITIGMQIVGNIAQGPANALIIDHVPDSQRGKASGVLNFMRLAGAGLVTLLVLAFMANYDPIKAPEWMWYSIITMSAVLVATTLYTLFALRLSKARPETQPANHTSLPKPLADIEEKSEETTSQSPIANNRWRFILFLIALAVSLAAMTSIQTNALFFLQDVVGLENPAQGGNLVLICLVGASAIVVYPVGKLSDRIGRGILLLIAGTLGAAGTLWLLLADSIFDILLPSIVIGVSVGIYLSVGWAVANDLVKKSTAARDLGLTGVSSLLGAILGRTSGFGIDSLNRQAENMGYEALIIGAAIAFMLSGIMLWRVVKQD